MRDKVHAFRAMRTLRPIPSSAVMAQRSLIFRTLRRDRCLPFKFDDVWHLPLINEIVPKADDKNKEAELP